MSPLGFLFLSFGTNDDIPDQVFSKLLDQPQLMPLWWYGDKSRQQSFPLTAQTWAKFKSNQGYPKTQYFTKMGKWRAEPHTIAREWKLRFGMHPSPVHGCNLQICQHRPQRTGRTIQGPGPFESIALFRLAKIPLHQSPKPIRRCADHDISKFDRRESA